MARVTVEDCVDKVTNRFELVLFAAHRARGMSAGAELLVEEVIDPPPVQRNLLQQHAEAHDVVEPCLCAAVGDGGALAVPLRDD